ncbi:MAG TPA: amidase [Mycobacteriales bacterium]|nr:amidase [Mycobacteriales bacterium]
MPFTTIMDAATALRSGAVSSVELTRSVLERARTWDEPLGAFLARYDESALAAAAQADAELAAGIDKGPLHGIPLGIKDIITTREGPTTAQSLILDPQWGNRQDAPVVARLRNAGAIIVGKTSTMEFAIGLPDPEKPFPVPRNPWDLDAWTGGSSSGTGAAVAAGLVLGGLGTDTGGSIRIPAAYCGITGLKPTFGRVPKSGCVPLGYSLDHIGPMARSAADCAAMLQIMAGYDASDPYSATDPVPDYAAALTGDLDGLRIGVERGALAAVPDAEPAVAAALDAAAAAFGELGATTAGFLLEGYADLTAVDWITMAAESFAYHRGDLAARWNDYGRPTRQFIAGGAMVSAADFLHVQRLRSQLARDVAGMFETHDVLIMPTAATGAPQIGSLQLESLTPSIFTPAWNTVGLPVAAVPMGFTAAGLPLSLQIIGPPMADDLVLRVADAFQRRTDWHLRVPQLRPGSRGTQLPLMPRAPELSADEARSAGAVRAALEAAGIRVGADEIAILTRSQAGMAGLLSRLARPGGELNPALGFVPVRPQAAPVEAVLAGTT